MLVWCNIFGIYLNSYLSFQMFLETYPVNWLRKTCRTAGKSEWRGKTLDKYFDVIISLPPTLYPGFNTISTGSQRIVLWEVLIAFFLVLLHSLQIIANLLLDWTNWNSFWYKSLITAMFRTQKFISVQWIFIYIYIYIYIYKTAL